MLCGLGVWGRLEASDQGKSTRVFLSYARADFHFVDLVRLKLEAAGITVWWDRDSLQPGQEWREGIEQGIASCHIVLVAMSPNSYNSPYVIYEWSYALGMGKNVIPLLKEPCNKHPRLERIQHLEFSNPAFQPWDTL